MWVCKLNDDYLGASQRKPLHIFHGSTLRGVPQKDARLFDTKEEASQACEAYKQFSLHVLGINPPEAYSPILVALTHL